MLQSPAQESLEKIAIGNAQVIDISRHRFHVL
jgi:hypothetical protein